MDSNGSHTAVELKSPTGTTNTTTDVILALASNDDSSEIRTWVKRSRVLASPSFHSLTASLCELDAHLTLRTYICRHTMSPADVVVWGALRGNRIALSQTSKYTNVDRWYHFIEANTPWIVVVVNDCYEFSRHAKTTLSSSGGSYDLSLPEVNECIVTRFPPEPSGYLHIGHGKAALLNDYFAHQRPDGKLILRFDDTNPSKESEEFENSIKEDLKLLDIKPDTISYSSDYFDIMHKLCIKIIGSGQAFADDTGKSTIKHERMYGIESRRRSASVEDNLACFEEMKNASDLGRTFCIRAKISVDDVNKALRDPVIFRCNATVHHRTGDKWKIYPTYDFCAPILDSLEGITLALRTNEYRDRNPQYHWIQKVLGLRKTTIWDFSRMSFTRTLLSKRKLSELVEMGSVAGWDDPRMPTLRGIKRRGMVMPALREFILSQGASRNIVNYDWTTIWAINKRHIDPIAPRFTAIEVNHAVHATVNGAGALHTKQCLKHRKVEALGYKDVVFGSEILLEQVDAKALEIGQEITLMNWGNAIVTTINRGSKGDIVKSLSLDLHLVGDFKMTEKKLTWLAAGQQLTPIEMVDFDFIITKDKLEKKDSLVDFLTPVSEIKTVGWGDCNVAALLPGNIIQFERKGFFRVDTSANGMHPAVLFQIPSGKTASK